MFLFTDSFGIRHGSYKTKKLHTSQIAEKESAGFTIFKINAIINYELINKILAIGPDAEVIEPEELRKQMMAIWEKGLNRYDLKNHPIDKSFL